MRALESSIECDAQRLIMAINMKELASVSCIVKGIKLVYHVCLCAGVHYVTIHYVQSFIY